MKKSLAFMVAVCALVITTFGQTTAPVRQPSLGINFTLTDFTTPNLIRSRSLSSVFRDKSWAKIRDMAPGISVSYAKGMTPWIAVFTATLNAAFVEYPFRDRPTSRDNDILLEGDASANFKLVTENYWVIPYVSAGIGAHMYKSYYGASLPLGVGFRINLFGQSGLNFSSQYRIPVTYGTSNYHFFHSIGVYGVINEKKEEPKPLPPIPVEKPKDTDGDGITDDKDKCPTVAGVEKYDGCPVPDTDKDGINDDNDKCPTVAGVARYQGCPIPDTDKDGINDEDDKCPNVAGVARYQGCPVPDTDGDGVNDEEDKCPTVPGVAENHGCPAIKEEVKQKVDYAAQNILFATGSYKLLASSNKGLDDVVKILQSDVALKLSIDGYTDNTGTPEKNQTLSESRANSVKDYMVKKGIDASRLTAAGHGQDQPIGDNKTASGRKKNRRVEMKPGY